MGGQAQEDVEGGCCKGREMAMCGLRLSTPEGRGRGQTEEMSEA